MIGVVDHARDVELAQPKAYVERVFARAGVKIEWSGAPGESCGDLSLFLARTTPGSVMGRSVVQDGIAWVYPNRVSTLAAQKNMDERIMLGRAIVHEVGHLLRLRHARDGVMRAELYTDAMEGRFAFSAAEAEAIRSEIASRKTTCK